MGRPGREHDGGGAPTGPTPGDVSWSEFERRLAKAVGGMPPETYLVLTTLPEGDAGSVYVQFAKATTTFRAEAVGSDYLPSDRPLTADQERRLGALGWRRPEPGATGRNFHRDWRLPPPPDEVASVAIRTLREVYAVSDPTRLRYVYSSFGGWEIEAPDLGIAPQERSPRRREMPASHRTGDELRGLVEEGIRRWLLVDDVVRDSDGDYPCRVGSTVVFLRVVEATPSFVLLFAPILRDIADSPALATELNAINARIRFGRVFWAMRQVIVATEITAVDATPDQVAITCMELGNLADQLDDALHGRFGGKTVFEARPPLVN